MKIDTEKTYLIVAKYNTAYKKVSIIGVTSIFCALQWIVTEMIKIQIKILNKVDL